MSSIEEQIEFLKLELDNKIQELKNNKNVYILTIKDGINYPAYDVYTKFVIAAYNEQEAREIAQDAGADECRESDFNGYYKIPFWTDYTKTNATILKVDKDTKIIAADFRAG